jgi:antitoxin component YwqK of YwqJK toxin-antitoxin module
VNSAWNTLPYLLSFSFGAVLFSTGLSYAEGKEESNVPVIFDAKSVLPDWAGNRVKAALEALPKGYKVRVKKRHHYDSGNRRSFYAAEVITPLNPAGKPDGLELHFSDWYQQASRKVPYKNGVMEGTEQQFLITQVWNDTSKRIENKWYLLAEIPWKNGLLEGQKKTFHSNSKLASHADYVKGQVSGESRSFDEEGNLTRLARYKKGEKDGEMIDYWPNGKPRRVVPYRLGKVDGVAKEFYLGGSIKWERPFKDNLQNGTEKHYGEDGTPTKVKYWLDGKVVSKEEIEKRR